MCCSRGGLSDFGALETHVLGPLLSLFPTQVIVCIQGKICDLDVTKMSIPTSKIQT